MDKKTKDIPTIDRSKLYPLQEAVELLPQISTSKFVGSVDADIVLNLTTKQLKETVRGSLTFPHQFGEAKKVIVFADEKDAKTAKAAGAVEAGLQELVKKVEEGKLDFDVVIATPDVMSQIAKLGKVLGPKGLMPTPNNGTVTKDVETAVRSYVSGKQNFKMSEQGVVRGRVAKLDMAPEQIVENIKALLAAITTETRKLSVQPFKRITLSPTMGAGIKVDTNSL